MGWLSALDHRVWQKSQSSIVMLPPCHPRAKWRLGGMNHRRVATLVVPEGSEGLRRLHLERPHQGLRVRRICTCGRARKGIQLSIYGRVKAEKLQVGIARRAVVS